MLSDLLMPGMKVNSYIRSVILFFFFAACTNGKVTPEEYILWTADPSNGLIQETNIGEFKFIVEYQPSEKFALRELLEDPDKIDVTRFDSIKREYEGSVYFLVKIGSADGSNDDFMKKGITSEREYFDRMQYFNSEVSNDIILVNGSDTLNCLMHHFERSYSLTSFNTLLLAFENTNKVNDLTLIINDQVLGVGKLKFFIAQQTLTRIPHIQFN